ncbi:MAG TPA: pyruvate kinase [Acidimicrobiales bacterium]|nr:pyruvate kinase [Acidimicrobiales bacterium]
MTRTGTSKSSPSRRYLEDNTRRTRVVATIGPASDSIETLSAMQDAGMDVARLPLAHGSIDEAVARLRRIRQAAPDVGILVDLPGPKIRSTPFPEGGVVLVAGSEVVLSPHGLAPSSDDKVIGVAVPELVESLQEGDRVALGDGGVSLVAEQRDGYSMKCRVVSGGRVQGRPGVTAPASRLALKTPTPEDIQRLEVLLEEGIEGVAVSFVRTAADLETVKAMSGRSVLVCAKMETPEALLDIDNILQVADTVMVARGDLGVRVALEEVPHIQKSLIRSCIAWGRPVITATQMLESMINSPVPTRAEVTDVANAVFDGTSAVMLSAESAVGIDPVNAVATMARIARRADLDFDSYHWGRNLPAQNFAAESAAGARITAAVGAAAWRASVDEKAAVIVACTNTGATARAIARFRPGAPIVAATPYEHTARQLTCSWGVDTVLVPEAKSTDEAVNQGVDAVRKAGYAKAGDVVVVLAGSLHDPEPVTDTLRLVRVY